MTSAPPDPPRWLMLLASVPAKPDYARVKLGRRLARLGAVAVKNGVHVLPWSEDALEDLAWVLQEVAEAGGEGSVVEARFVAGLDDAAVEALFRAARDAAAAPWIAEARALLASPDTPGEAEVERLRGRLAEIAALDFFASDGRAALESLVLALTARRAPAASPSGGEPARPAGQTWVTRRGVRVDRIASAWLIRRFIDPDARFRFVDAKGYAPAPGELRFDMYEAEYTHEGELCTFEVLIRRFELAAPGLTALAEIVHDIDLKDGRHGRPETAGVAAMLDAIAAAHADDETRIARGATLLDELLGWFGGRA